jgi:mono/diheme cytochrome c family protein
MKSRFVIIFILSAVLLSACNFSLASDITPPPNYKSPTPAPTLGALFPVEAPSLQNGAAIYTEKCAPCHGDEGRGDGPQGLQLSVKVPAFGLPSVGRAAIPSNYFTIVSQGKIENFMPPFSGSLNEQQRWDVVAYALSLHTSAEELSFGKALYEANCVECHGEDGSAIAKVNLSDQQFMAKRTEQDLFNAMTKGANGMPAFDQLTEDERWALAAYVRSLTFAEVVSNATPPPSPTEADTPTPAESTPEGTFIPIGTAESTSQPVLDATPVPTIAPNTTGNVTGSIANISGGTLPAGLVVSLFGFDHGQDATAPEQILEVTTEVQADGSYTFENVEIPEGRFFIAQVNHRGVPYESEIAITEPGVTQIAMAPIAVYETTDDLNNLQVDQGHLIIQFDEARIGVLEFFAISNPGDKTVVFTTDGQTLPFAPMPEGVETLGFDLQQGEAQFISTADGFAIPPSDKQYAVVTGYALPYDKSAELTVPFGITVPSVNLIAPVGVKIVSDQLTSQPSESGSENLIFSAGPFAIGDTLTFEVSGKPRIESAPATSVDENSGVLIGIGALGLALIAVGVFLFLRDRSKSQDEDDEIAPEPTGESTEEIMDAIIALDDQYRAGNISEDAYQKRRADLKAQLKDRV